MRFKSSATPIFIELFPGWTPSSDEWNCIQLLEEVTLHHPQPLLRHDCETTSDQRFVKSHLLANHIFHIPAKGVCCASRDRHGAMDFTRMLFTYGQLPEWRPVLQDRAKIFVQPDD